MDHFYMILSSKSHIFEIFSTFFIGRKVYNNFTKRTIYLHWQESGIISEEVSVAFRYTNANQRYSSKKNQDGELPMGPFSRVSEHNLTMTRFQLLRKNKQQTTEEVIWQHIHEVLSAFLYLDTRNR